MQYGIPYKGSKSKIAEDILATLPIGNRLIDLFGGGFAISHCALVKYPYKRNSVVYNDINPLLLPLIQDAIDGKYNYNVFTPEWISRDRFFEDKEKDGYIKWMWSFGSNGCDYLYGRNIEEAKRQAHQLVVFGEENELTKGIKLSATDIHSRRMEFMAYIKSLGKRNNLQHLEHLERLQHLERLEHLELWNISYEQYEYRDGDIVYCDIPYSSDPKTKTYTGTTFDTDAFMKWAKSRPYPVYFSEYIPGELIWSKKVTSTMGDSNNAARYEALMML